MEVDMFIFSLILVLLFIFIATFIFFLWQAGFLISIEIKTAKPPFDALQIAYKYLHKPYRECELAFTEILAIADHFPRIGVYYDDPTESGERSIRYIVGVVLNTETSETNDAVKSNFLSKGYKIMNFPNVDHIVYSTFPKKDSLSNYVGVQRMFPKFRDYVKEKELQAYPMIELFELTRIVYAAPLSKQEEFFVEELLTDPEGETMSDPRTMFDSDSSSVRETEEFPMSTSSIDSSPLTESKDDGLNPSMELVDDVAEKGKELNSDSDRSSSSFEELELDS